MKKVICRRIINLLCLTFLFMPVFVNAQSSQGQTGNQKVQLKGGAIVRLRHEYWKNHKDMDNGQLDNRNFFRMKSSLWGQADIEKNLTFFAKLTNEFKPYTYFGGTTSSVPDKSAGKKGYRFDINEVVFDNLYGEIRNLLGLPLDVRIGRQDLVGLYGENFLIADGTPNDGSRTAYFNAVKTSWRTSDLNTLDVVYVNEPRDEELLPVINRTRLVNVSARQNDKVDQSLTTTDEQGVMLYLKNKSIKNLAAEPYYIFKYEAAEGGSGYQAVRSRIHALGTYAKYDLSPWAFRGQLAGQMGSYGHNARSALGGNIFVDREFKSMSWKPKASAGWVYLSGDRKRTDRNEGWDPLFSRVVSYSDIYATAISAESGIYGYWTNVQIWRTEFSVKPTEKSKVSFLHNFLRANEQIAASAIFSGTGKNRGHLLQGRLDYVFNKFISAYFLTEYFIPGNFYRDKDDALFLRTELQIKF